MKNLFPIIIVFLSHSMYSQVSFKDSEVLFQPEALSQSFVPVNVDHDGLPDLIVVVRWGNNQRVVWKKNLGNGTFSEEILISDTIDQPQYLTTGDINNDGYEDLLIMATKGDFYFFRNDGNGNFKETYTVRLGYSYQAFLKDLNHDNFDDLIFWSYGDDSIGFLINDKRGKFEEKIVVFDSLNKIVDIDISDLDNDGDQDFIAVSNSPGKLVVFENVGDLNFAEPNFILYKGRQPQSVAFAEMNGDNLMDIVATASANDDVSIFINKGNGEFDHQLRIGTIDWADKLFINDIDDDGDNDILIGQTYGSAAIIYNEGHLNFSSPEFSIYVAPNTENRYNNNYGAWTIWSIDIDGDCDQDVITQEENLFLFKNQKQDNCEEEDHTRIPRSEIDFSISPNPASTYLNITVKNVNLYQANVISLKGELLMSVDNQSKIDLLDIPSGVYILQVRDIEDRISKCLKFIVAK